jgi:hypothetical protein
MSDHASTTPNQHHFTAVEWDRLKKEDLHAGKAVVGLIAGIFTIGLLLYTGVFLSVLI